MISVEIYRAPGCHLCEEAEALLSRLAPELGLAVRAIDITTDPDLEARFRPEIPVVFLEGRKAYKYRVDEGDLRRRVERIRRGPA
jgi:thiol-disulfide isomerase/thioredoxin